MNTRDGGGREGKQQTSWEKTDKIVERSRGKKENEKAQKWRQLIWALFNFCFWEITTKCYGARGRQKGLFLDFAYCSLLCAFRSLNNLTKNKLTKEERKRFECRALPYLCWLSFQSLMLRLTVTITNSPFTIKRQRRIDGRNKWIQIGDEKTLYVKSWKQTNRVKTIWAWALKRSFKMANVIVETFLSTRLPPVFPSTVVRRFRAFNFGDASFVSWI